MTSITSDQNTSIPEVLRGWVVGFGRFWYQFIIGDDWRIAGAVVAALLAAWGLQSVSVPAWWLVPIAVVTVTYLTLVDKARSSSQESSSQESSHQG